MSTSTKGKTVRTKNSHSIKVEASDILSQNRTLLAVLLLLLGLYANINHYEKEEKKRKRPKFMVANPKFCTKLDLSLHKKISQTRKRKKFQSCKRNSCYAQMNISSSLFLKEFSFVFRYSIDFA